MRRPKFLRKIWPSPQGVPRSQESRRPTPPSSRPFRVPKPLSEMLLIKHWGGFNKGDLLTILRHWPLPRGPRIIQRKPLFSPLFWRSFLPLRRFLLTRYPGRLGEGNYAALSLFFAATTSPLLDMVWEEGPGVTPTTYEEYSFSPSSEAETSLKRRGPLSSPPVPSSRAVKMPLAKRIPLLLRRLVRGRVSPQPAKVQPLGRKEEIFPQGTVPPSTEIERGIFSKLQAKLPSGGLMGLIQRRVRGPALHRGKGLSQTHHVGRDRAMPPSEVVEGRKELEGRPRVHRRGASAPPFTGGMFVPRPRPFGQELPETVEKGSVSPAKPSSPHSVVSQEEFQGRPPKSLPAGYLFRSIIKTSLWAQRTLARLYPRSHLVKGTEGEPGPGKAREIVHHPAGVESPKGGEKRIVRGQEVPLSPPLGEEPTGGEVPGAIEPSTEEVVVTANFEGREETAAPSQVSVPPPIVSRKPPLAARVLARLHPRYRKARKSSVRGKRVEVYEGAKSGELREEIRHIGDELPLAEPTRSPLGRGSLNRVQQRRGEIGQKGLGKRDELGKRSATFEPSLLGESQSPPGEDVSPLQPVGSPIFQAAQAAFKALAQGPGIPLDMGIKRKFESFFGMGLEEVRLHHGAAAAEVTGRLGAAAVTMGSHIFLSPRVSQAHTKENIGLLAHELTHVVQGKTLQSKERMISEKLEEGLLRRPWGELDHLPHPLASGVAPQGRPIPPLMAAPLQRAASTSSVPRVTAQITEVSSAPPAEEEPKEDLEEMALLVYERIKRRLQNEGERLPG